jgi:radical SAM protein with 4Fe4S-binding SPASM domain
MLDKRWPNFFFQDELSKIKLDDYSKGKVVYPLDVVIHLTTSCNHSCSFCYHKLNYKKEHIFFDFDRLMKLLGELKEINIRNLVISGGGEPLLYPKLKEFILELDNNFEKVSIYTNLDFPKEKIEDIHLEKLSLVNVNLNVLNSRLYKKTRGENSNLERVLENLKFLSAKTKVNVIMTVREDTMNQVKESLNELLKINLNKIIISPSFNLKYSDKKNSNSCAKKLEEIKEKFNSPKIKVLEFEEKSIKKGKKVFCGIHTFDITIGTNESIYPCCNVAYLKNQDILNLKDYSSFNEAIESKEFLTWSKRQEIKCKYCWFASANKQIKRSEK